MLKRTTIRFGFEFRMRGHISRLLLVSLTNLMQRKLEQLGWRKIRIWQDTLVPFLSLAFISLCMRKIMLIFCCVQQNNIVKLQSLYNFGVFLFFFSPYKSPILGHDLLIMWRSGFFKIRHCTTQKIRLDEQGFP